MELVIQFKLDTLFSIQEQAKESLTAIYKGQITLDGHLLGAEKTINGEKVIYGENKTIQKGLFTRQKAVSWNSIGLK